MSLEWRENALRAKFEAIAPKGLSAEHMLADIMTIYAPPEALRRAIDGADLAVQPDRSRGVIEGRYADCEGSLFLRDRAPIRGRGALSWRI